MDEFAEACDLLQKHLPKHDTKEELMEMCKLMDINKDGLVDLNEFLETFRLCEQERSNSFKCNADAINGDKNTTFNGIYNRSSKQNSNDSEN